MTLGDAAYGVARDEYHERFVSAMQAHRFESDAPRSGLVDSIALAEAGLREQPGDPELLDQIDDARAAIADALTLEPAAYSARHDFEAWVAAEMQRRVWLLWVCTRPDMQRAVCDHCARDPVFWVDNFLWTFDPRPSKSPNVIPFVLWGFQREILRSICFATDATGRLWPTVIDKSRDMGVTWVALVALLWGWQFHGQSFGLISRTQADVDDNSEIPDSLFGRLRFLLSMQPRWLRPEYVSRYCALQQPATGSTDGAIIKGTSTVDDAFRSKRYRRVFVDEANMIRDLRAVMASINDVTEAPLLVSSAKGRGTHFARIVHGDEGDVHEHGSDLADAVGWLHYRAHYSLHPDRDQTTERGRAWRRREQARRTRWEWQQEQEIDYAASMPARIFHAFGASSHVYRWPAWREHIAPIVAGRDVSWIEGWDFGDGLSLTFVVWVAYDHTDDVAYVYDWRAWQGGDVRQVALDVHEAGWRTSFDEYGDRRAPTYRVGDPAGLTASAQRVGGRVAQTSSWVENLRPYGIDITPQYIRSPYNAFQLVNRKLTEHRILFSPFTAERRAQDQAIPPLAESVGLHHWAVRGNAQTAVEYEGRDAMQAHKGVHSHGCDALVYAMAKIWSPQGFAPQLKRTAHV